MVSSTRQSERRVAFARAAQGRARKASEARGSTIKFPVHPEGYSASAPDAKKKA